MSKPLEYDRQLLEHIAEILNKAKMLNNARPVYRPAISNWVIVDDEEATIGGCHKIIEVYMDWTAHPERAQETVAMKNSSKLWKTLAKDFLENGGPPYDKHANS